MSSQSLPTSSPCTDTQLFRFENFCEQILGDKKLSAEERQKLEAELYIVYLGMQGHA